MHLRMGLYGALAVDAHLSRRDEFRAIITTPRKTGMPQPQVKALGLRGLFARPDDIPCAPATHDWRAFSTARAAKG